MKIRFTCKNIHSGSGSEGRLEGVGTGERKLIRKLL